MRHTIHVTIAVDIEAPDARTAEDAAGTWACAMLEGIRPKCTACNGRGRVIQWPLHTHYDECPLCHGAQTLGEHPYRPRVYRAKEAK